MPTEILMPALSPTMEEGTLAKWLVKEGDTVNSGDLLAEIETDKATMEFEAVDEGTIGKILIAEGSEGVKVNTPIAVLLEEGESADDIDSAAPAPQASDSGSDGSDGSSDKTAEKPAPKDSGSGADSGADSTTAAPAAPRNSSGERVFASPLARRIAADKGIDLTGVKGSGPRGRIVKADLEGASAPARADSAKTDTAAPAAAPASAQMPAGPSADAPDRSQADRAAFLPAPRHPP